MNALHEVGTLILPDDGPSHIQVDCTFDDVGFTAGQWLVGIEIVSLVRGRQQ